MKIVNKNNIFPALISLFENRSTFKQNFTFQSGRTDNVHIHIYTL